MPLTETVVAPRFANGEEDGFIEEAGRIRKTTLSITDLRQRNIEDKAAGQRRGDLAVYVDGSRLIVDVAVADATAPSYRRPPPRHPSPAKNRRRPTRRPLPPPPRSIVCNRASSPCEDDQVSPPLRSRCG